MRGISRERLSDHRDTFFGPALGCLVFVALIWAGVLFPPACLGGEAEEAIDRAIAAHGGAEAIEKTEMMGRRQGTFTQFFPAPNSGSFVEWRKGDLLRLEVQIAGLEVIQGYDGNKGWVQSFGQVIDAPDQIQTAIEQEQRHNLMLLVHAGGDDYRVETAVASTLLDSTLVSGVTVFPADDSPPTSLYFDPETGYVVKMAFTDVNPYKGGEASFEYYFLEYTTSEGIPYPSRVIHYIDGVRLDEVAYESVDFSAEMEDAEFKKPGADRGEALGDKQTSIPLEYAFNMLFIETTINDSAETSSFLVDTGAGLTCLSREAAKKFGIETQGDMSAAGAGGALDVKTARLDSITMGDLTVRDLEVMVIDIATMSGMLDRQIDGILGYNVLNRFTTTIDINGGSITFADSDAPLPEGEGIHTLPMQVLMGVPVIKGTVDGTAELDFLIDTGAAVSVLPKAVADSLEPKKRLEGAMAAGADTRPIEMALARFTEIALDGAKIPDPVFSTPVSPPSNDPVGSVIDTANRGILGTALLRNFRMTLNYDRARLALDPLASVPGKDLEWCGPGVAIYREEGEVTVRAVYGGSPADGMVKPGDQILRIDGSDLEELPLNQVIGLLRGKPDSSVELVIKRNGEELTLSLKRERLL